MNYFDLAYPWPLVNILNRNSMFTDTQQTIMSLLCVNLHCETKYPLNFHSII